MKAAILLGLFLRCVSGAPPPPATCAAITNPAPCGQNVDTQAMCEAKNCCWKAGAKSALGATPCYFPGGNLVNITTVMVVQSCHFDAGFADTTVNILNRWFDSHFPNAHSLGLQLDARGGAERLHFMAQSWIVSLYMDCPPNAGLHCPSAGALANFSEAVKKGYITWHAFPFNGELELADASSITDAVALTHALDDQFNVSRKAVFSQRDVPGTTRSALPILAAAGVRAVSVGVNGASTPPDVPRAFVWVDPVSGISLPALWHPYGYGGNAFEDAVIIPGLSTALVMDWRGDNAGPPANVQEVVNDWANIGKVFPGAKVVAATFSDFLPLLEASAAAGVLPVVEAELGDTWVHGSASDPLKLAMLRVGNTLRTECIASGACDVKDYAFKNFSRFFLKNYEHTFGKDIKTFLKDTTHWSNALLQQQLAAKDPHFVDVINSWVEQRAWGIDYALGALPDAHPLKVSLLAAFAALKPGAPPNPSALGFTPSVPNMPYSTGAYTVEFDAGTGALSLLTVAGANAVTWVNASADGAKLGLLEYQTYDEDTFNAYIANYSVIHPPPSWFALDFGKPNMSSAGTTVLVLQQTLVSLWSKASTDGSVITWLAEVSIDGGAGGRANSNYGGPAAVWIGFDVPAGAAGVGKPLNITVGLFNKTATRIGEAMFMRFNASGGPSWTADVLQGAVNPGNVVPAGNQHQHGVQRGVTATTSRGAMNVSSKEAALAVFGALTGFPTPTRVVPDKSFGFAYNLFNNIWGTNYPAWYPFLAGDENMRFHFSLQFSQ